MKFSSKIVAKTGQPGKYRIRYGCYWWWWTLELIRLLHMGRWRVALGRPVHISTLMIWYRVPIPHSIST